MYFLQLSNFYPSFADLLEGEIFFGTADETLPILIALF